MNEELLTCDELALRLRIRPSTVRSWAKEGRLPVIRIGRKVIRFDYEAVKHALQSQSDLDEVGESRRADRG